jgi:subtilisin family serine protease
MDDVYGHGTHVTSTIVGRNFAPTQLPTGVLPNASAWCYNIFKRTPTAGNHYELNFWAFYTALFTIRLKEPVSVINLSIWMKFAPSDTLSKEFAKIEAADIVMVTCSGNHFDPDLNNKSNDYNLGKDSNYRVLYPARLPNFLSVGAVTPDYKRASFSRFSTWNQNGWNGNDYFGNNAGRWPLVDVAAPGWEVWGASLDPADHPDLLLPPEDTNLLALPMWGTSMAAPQVTAAIGAIRALYPKWQHASAADVRQLVRSAFDVQDMQLNFGSTTPMLPSEVFGAGLLDFVTLDNLAGQ